MCRESKGPNSQMDSNCSIQKDEEWWIPRVSLSTLFNVSSNAREFGTCAHKKSDSRSLHESRRVCPYESNRIRSPVDYVSPFQAGHIVCHLDPISIHFQVFIAGCVCLSKHCASELSGFYSLWELPFWFIWRFPIFHPYQFGQRMFAIIMIPFIIIIYIYLCTCAYHISH